MYGDDGHAEMMQAEAAAYDAGVRAAMLGKARADNPYRVTDGRFPEWLAGWDAYSNDEPSHRQGCGCAYCAEPENYGVRED